MQTIVSIYRLEHPVDHKGIHRSCMVDDLNATWYDEHVDRHRNFPTSFFEFGISAESRKCAFNSLSDVDKWVGKSTVQHFVEIGFRLFEIKVIDCRQKMQSIYKEDDIVAKIDISEMYLSDEFRQLVAF